MLLLAQAQLMTDQQRGWFSYYPNHSHQYKYHATMHTCAMAMAIADSVTVSMGELTMGTRSLMLRVTKELRSTYG